MSTFNSSNHKWRVFGITALVYVFICLLLAMPVEAVRLNTNWATRVDLSEKIVRGQVIDVKSHWNPERTLIQTDVTILIDEHIKGNGSQEITLTIPGGTVGDDTQLVSDTPQFVVGDYGVILLESSGCVTGGPDGFYSLQKPMGGANQLQSIAEDRFLPWIRSYVNGQTQASFEELSKETSSMPMQQETSYATIGGVSPSTISAGTGSVLTIYGSGFGSWPTGGYPTIGFRYKDNYYMSWNTYIRSWSDSQIQVEVFTAVLSGYPYSPGSWSDQYGTVAFINSSRQFESYWPLTVTFGYGGAKWTTLNNGTFVAPYYTNATGGPSGSESAMVNAANTWNGAPANFTFNYMGSTSRGYGKDGYNVLSFANLGSSTIIAQATSWFSGGVVTESDIQFNTTFPFSTDSTPPSNKMDLETIAVHELGHWLRLLDLYGQNDTAKVMYGICGYGQVKRSLDSADQEGIRWIYPAPPATTLISPSGLIFTKTPTYTWYAVSNATHYYLWVNDSTGNKKILQWYTAAQAGCASGTGTCSATPATEVIGLCQWWVQTYNGAGYGPWSSGMSFTVEAVSAPNIPSGPSSGKSSTSYTYSVSGSTSNLGHSIQYLFDWGDGTNSGWLPVGTTSASKSWASVGTYRVKAQARCFTHISTVSPWSGNLPVSIENVSNPATPSGRTSGVYGASYTYFTGGSSSDLGDSIQYFFDWGDGTNSGWLPVGTTSASKSWASVGTYLVKAQARCATHTSNVSNWSNSLSVNIISPPPAATLVSPSGTIHDTTPTYTWNAVSEATWYQLYVNDSTGNRIQQWYTAEDAGCASGTRTCSVTPATVLTPGGCRWRIQTWNSQLGGGTWSSPMLFTVVLILPTATTLVSPSGPIADTTPTYIWSAVSDATWYQLYVNDSTGNKIQQWFTADACGCASGTGTCTVTPTTEVLGSCKWWVQTYGSAGFGPWSASLSFTTQIPTAPIAATLVSPSGGPTTDTTPTYTWNAVSNSTWYYLRVNDSAGTKIQKWYTASEAGCPAGTGTCSVTPTTEVLGSCKWWIQTYNTKGYGPWSASMSFTTQIPTGPPVAATQISPSGETGATRPIYSWNAVSTATWYWLYVNDSTGNKISQWYAASDAGCPDGTATCSVTPSVALAPGASQWWIQTYNSAGYGPWSTGKSFVILTQSLYDDFSEASINKDKWGQGELVREIRGGELVSKATAYGSRVINNLDFKDPASIGYMEADVMIEKIEGDYDPDDSNEYSLPNARLTGFFYNDGTASGPGSHKGEVQGIIRIMLYRGEVKAQWAVWKSLDDEATSWETLGSGIFPDMISLNIPYKLSIQFESSLKRFTFELGTLTSTWTSTDTINPSNVPWKAIGTDVSFFPTTPSPHYGKVSASFDHVIAKDESGVVLLSDDFSSSTLDSSKWATYEMVKEISGGKLRSKVRSSSGSTSPVYNNLDFLYPSSIDFIQTNVTPVTYQNSQGAQPVARIAGIYYNDGTGTGIPGDHTGDVAAQVWVGGTGVNPAALWTVDRITDPAAQIPQSLAYGTFTTPITLGNTYTLSLGWDGSQLTFRINNEEATYTPTTAVNPPNVPWRGIGTRIWDPAGKEATIEALFDDVVVYYGPPSAATLVSPSGTINDTTPTYTWNAVSDATWYQLYVNDSTGNKIQKCYTASELGCAAGTGTCSLTPTTEVIGSCQWKVQTYNPAGFGSWSAAMSFTISNQTPPIAATLISPSGTITDTTPTYTWNAVSGATWYGLWVNDSTGMKIQQWYTASAVGCANGTGTCSVTPTTEVIKSCQWWIRTYNIAGYGPWSAPLSFTVPPPPAATPGSPSGTITNTTPTYTWNAVSGVTWYRLRVNDSTGNKIQQWYTASALGYASGTGTCSITPTTEVIGSCQWWIQTYNTAGYGPESDPLSFTTPIPIAPPGVATLISPSGTITTTTPTYTWNAVSNSPWYYLYVNDSTGTKIQQWYTASAVGCVDGTGTCSVTPSTVLASGAGKWWIQTYNTKGYGPWSAPLSFTVSPW